MKEEGRRRKQTRTFCNNNFLIWSFVLVYMNANYANIQIKYCEEQNQIPNKEKKNSTTIWNVFYCVFFYQFSCIRSQLFLNKVQICLLPRWMINFVQTSVDPFRWFMMKYWNELKRWMQLSVTNIVQYKVNLVQHILIISAAQVMER